MKLLVAGLAGVGIGLFGGFHLTCLALGQYFEWHPRKSVIDLYCLAKRAVPDLNLYLYEEV